MLLVEAGGAASGSLPYDLTALEFILRGEAALGTAAHNLARDEAALPVAVIRDLAARTNIPWVSSNLRLPTGEYLCEPLRVVERGGRRAVILGVLSPDWVLPGLKADDPAAAIRTVLEQYGWQDRRPDALVVLADLQLHEARALAAALPPDALLILRDPGKPSPDSADVLTDIPGCATVRVCAQGSGLVQATRGAKTNAWECQTLLLDERYSADEWQAAHAVNFQRELAQRDFSAGESRFGAVAAEDAAFTQPNPRHYAGSQSCRACHQAEALAWAMSPHARAWQMLVDRGQQFDSRCQSCHTTGFGRPAGFAGARSGTELTAVHCEACHGPAQLHAVDPRVPTPHVAKESCVQCHNAEANPGFQYDPAWLRIMHGRMR